MKQNFQNWWDARYFYTSHPFYKSYKRLSDLGGDFVYIDFLCSTLLFGDTMAERIWKKGKTAPHPFAPFGEPVMAAIKLTAEGVIYLTIKLLQERKLLDSSLDPDELIPHSERIEMAMAALGGGLLQIKKNIREKEDRKLEPGWRIVEQTPVLKLLVTLLPRIYVSIKKRARRPDPLGNFFLLALTEHMRERRGRPYYLDAQRLLQKLRRSRNKSGIQDRQTATVKVAKFKREYSQPSSELYPPWQNLVGLLQEQFKLWINKQKLPPEMRRWFDETYHKPVSLPGS